MGEDFTSQWSGIFLPLLSLFLFFLFFFIKISLTFSPPLTPRGDFYYSLEFVFF